MYTVASELPSTLALVRPEAGLNRIEIFRWKGPKAAASVS